MANIRRRKSRRKAKVNTTKPGKKQKKKQKKVQVGLDSIRQRWDHKKTLRKNLSNLGLAFDPNSAVPLKTEEKHEEFGSVEEYKTEASVPEPTELVKELEELSAQPVKKRGHRMSLSEAKFIAELIKTHATDYKKMVRDKRNYNQLTENQLQRKCKEFQSSPYIHLLATV